MAVPETRSVTGFEGILCTNLTKTLIIYRKYFFYKTFKKRFWIWIFGGQKKKEYFYGFFQH